MTDSHRRLYCPRCGEPLTGDDGECPDCASRAKRISFTPQTVLLASFVLLAFLFLVTGFVARMNRSREERLAREWTLRGSVAMKSGQPSQALDAFRNALVYAPNDRALQLLLTQALVESDHVSEAQIYLLSLWQKFPGDGQVNLELARISARQGQVQDAIQYYHSAIYAVWSEQTQEQRRQVRRELCLYLIAQGQMAQAQVQLAGLITDTPADDTEQRMDIAGLFLRANDPGHALAGFREVLREEPRQREALDGAGHAAFLLGDYQAAARYLSRAGQAAPLSSDSAALLATSQQVLRSDPFLLGLTDRERARRTLLAFHQGLQRLRDCAGKKGIALTVPPGPAELQISYADSLKFQQEMIPSHLRSDPELLNQAMAQVFQMENTAARACGAPAGLDEALLLIGKKHLGGEQ